MPLFDAAIRELRNAKSQGASEPRLILIKRAERTSSKSEGRSNMQDIQGTSAEEPGLGSGNPPGMRKSRGRYRHDTDQAVVHILGKRKQNSLLLRSAQLFRKMRQWSALMTAAAAAELASGTKREKRKLVSA